MSLPFVSCVTPTYNRRKFLPYLLYIFAYQEYPKNKRELVILDDSPTSNQDLIDEWLAKNPGENVRYIYKQEKIKLGRKRNMLNEIAKGEIIIAFDDDDYYPPEKIKHAVKMMNQNKVELCGSSEIYVYFTKTKEIYISGPFSTCHSTNGTVAFRKSYFKQESRRYDDNADKAEEKAFFDNFLNPIFQIESLKTILCISHVNNTVDKYPMREHMKPCKLKLKDIVKDKKLYNFYLSLADEEFTKKESSEQV